MFLFSEGVSVFIVAFAISMIIVHLWLYSDNVNPQPRQGSWFLILV